MFDVVANNTDRKSGHCLLEPRRRGDHVWAIDNGLCFAATFKLRTVIWEFAGEPLTDAAARAVARVADGVPVDVAELLAPTRSTRSQRRARWLAEHRRASRSTTAATATRGRSSDRGRS